jgi:radical SAM protein with 4Fe4S-binding SPASM domain
MSVLSLLQRFKSKVLSQNKPKRIVLETTNRCNLNCPFCLVGMQNELLEKHGNTAHDLLSRGMGTMSEETFEKVRHQLKPFGIEAVYLHFQGEPFLNKLTPDFARRLKKDGMYVGVFTNGQAFNEKIIEGIAAAEIDLIRFSVDGASESTYQKNRVGGKFSVVYENMRNVALAHRGLSTRIEWQYLPLKNNEHEVELAREMASEIGVHFFTKGFRETDPELAPSDPKYRSSFNPKPCTDIYKQLGIYWNGDVVPCCYDVDGKAVMGNVVTQRLDDIWNSPKYRKFRQCVDEAPKRPESEPDICLSCLRWR